MNRESPEKTDRFLVVLLVILVVALMLFVTQGIWLPNPFPHLGR